MKNKLLYIAFSLIILSWVMVYASQSIEITKQTSTWVWSNSSNITFSIDSYTWSTKYINHNDDSEIIWNYFEWYYYDNYMWFFKLNWSADTTKNVKIISSTNKCVWGYWYKIWWYAYSNHYWLIDFDYNNDIFVYYCTIDNKLHWYAYLETIWFQNFEWIKIENISPANIAVNSNNPFFVNDSSMILLTDYKESNWELSVVDWEKKNIHYWDESIFYIFKPKK